MTRSEKAPIRSRTGGSPHLLVLSISTVLTCWACGGSEQEVLNRFFIGVENEDHGMVATVSMVGFPGEGVASWRVLSVRPTHSERFRLSELRVDSLAAKRARDEQFSRFSDFRRANYDDLVTMLDRLDEDPGQAFSGRLAELRGEWDAYMDERKTLEGNLRELEQAMEAERRPARESVLTGEEIDLFEGEVLTQEILVGVRVPGAGGDEETPYLFTLRKYNLTRRQDDFTPPSRWIITSIEEQEG
ncbi:MAG: hypothetical protein ACRD1X_01940 [Vicinamibacteria bacterium]